MDVSSSDRKRVGGLPGRDHIYRLGGRAREASDRQPSVGELDQLLVTEVRHLQVSVTMSDSDEMGEAFQAILRSRKAEVEEQLDGLGAATRQLLVVDQDRHDSIFESTWESHEKLVDEIVTATFLPVAQRVPAARGADGRPDCVVEMLLDVALRLKRFVHRISQNDEVVRVVSELPTATLPPRCPATHPQNPSFSSRRLHETLGQRIRGPITRYRTLAATVRTSCGFLAEQHPSISILPVGNAETHSNAHD